ncbi:MAG: MFS transporter [Alphaproteobacteria bacterium]|nr:MFS transporter [Alphaproteobacteria bacterium]
MIWSAWRGWLRTRSTRDERLDLNGIFGSVGTAGAAIVAGTLADLWGWRTAYIVSGILAILVGIALVVCIALGIVRDREGQARPLEETSVRAMKRVFGTLVVTIVSVRFIFQATSVALPKLFSERLFASEGSAMGVGALVSLIYVLSAVAKGHGGELTDRYPQRNVFSCASYYRSRRCYWFSRSIVGSWCRAPC